MWMLLRTTLDQFWSAYSDDGGLNWRVLEPSGIDAWFASHPKSEKRANRIEDLIVEFETEGLKYPK